MIILTLYMSTQMEINFLRIWHLYLRSLEKDQSHIGFDSWNIITFFSSGLTSIKGQGLEQVPRDIQ